MRTEAELNSQMDAYRNDIANIKETYAQEIENHESAIKRAESEKADYSAKVKDVQQQIDAYILTDPVATKRAGLEKERKALKSAGGSFIIWMIILEVLLFIASLFMKELLQEKGFIRIIMHAAPLLLLIPAFMKLIAAGKLKPQIKELSKGLKEFDVHKNELEDEQARYEKQVKNCESRISDLRSKIKQANRQRNDKVKDLEEKIEDCQADMKYAPLAKNHVMIFVGEKNSYSGEYRSMRNEIIIDGISYGAAGIPFKAITLTPGLHAVQVLCQVYFSEEYHTYASVVDQINVENGSVFMKFEFKGPGSSFYGEKFFEASDFFKATKQKP